MLPLKSTLFSVAVLFIKSHFADFLLGKMFRMAAYLKPWFHIAQMSFKICFVRTYPDNPQNLTRDSETQALSRWADA